MTDTPDAASSDSHNSMIKQKLKIDKLTLLLDPPDMLKEGVIGYCKGLICHTDMLAKCGMSRSYSPGSRGYEISIAGKVPTSTTPLIWSQDTAYLLQVGGKGDRPLLRLDINPLGLTANGLEYLRDKLDGILALHWPWWAFAHVSRIDIALDLYGVRITDWVWDMPKRTSRDVICRQREVRTIYLGAKTASHFAIYNKAKQVPELAGGQELTRVEFRQKNAGLVGALLNLANPFAALDVFDPKYLSSLPNAHKQALMSVGHLAGWHGILKTFPKTTHLDLNKKCMKTHAQWWDPAEIWKSWNKCLLNTLPSTHTPSGPLYPEAAAYMQALKLQSSSNANTASNPLASVAD